MDSYSSSILLPVLDYYKSWRAALGLDEALSTGVAASMLGEHDGKRRRLSRLLERLDRSAGVGNNNNYPTWLPLPAIDKVEDVPLDLSIKSYETSKSTEPEQPAFVCGACGQTFDVHDRLAKHVASRHRSRTPEAVRAYECEVCKRRFARSDMLTRHARLHSGLKPYACGACGQVFSRSDHLVTHQRTHTGEKPYRCAMCPYAACRRDMITRHMRTHLRRTAPASPSTLATSATSTASAATAATASLAVPTTATSTTAGPCT